MEDFIPKPVPECCTVHPSQPFTQSPLTSDCPSLLPGVQFILCCFSYIHWEAPWRYWVLCTEGGLRLTAQILLQAVNLQEQSTCVIFNILVLLTNECPDRRLLRLKKNSTYFVPYFMFILRFQSPCWLCLRSSSYTQKPKIVNISSIMGDNRE